MPTLIVPRIPESGDDKTGKGKKSGNAKGQHHNPAGHGNGGKRKADHGLDFVANTNTHDKGQWNAES